MKKIGTYLLYGSALVFAIALVYVSTSNKENNQDIGKDKAVIAKSGEIKNTKSAEKIQVFLFHATQRCATCIAIGKLAEKTVDQNFSAELKFGRIEFREINIDLPENKELAAKFKATGSALFINNIYDGQDHIKDDPRVWQLTSNEQSFISYLTAKLNGMLDGSASV